jgi:dTDP-4-dehydrorhamnose reductase
MIHENQVLFTGGSGLLGKAVSKLLPKASYPSSTEFDVTDFAGMENYTAGKDFRLLFHAAAFTSPPKIDQDPVRALATNIIGTANVVKLCAARGWKLVYVSTDYVLDGRLGDYKEDDPVYPVNKYAWSKLGGECAVRLYDNSLIVRTSFGPDAFPYDKAFVDQWTSREPVSRLAAKVAKLIFSDVVGTIHVGGSRQTVYEYARSLDAGKEIGRLSTADVNFSTPRDTSLQCDRYKKVIG